MDNLIEIRWHGRGGQGAKTASLLLADAAFNTGKYIQGFPEYGPERMGAPITAYNRISTEPITIHSNIYEPDYVVVVDDTLLESVDVTGNSASSDEASKVDVYYTFNGDNTLNYRIGSMVWNGTYTVSTDDSGKQTLAMTLNGNETSCNYAVSGNMFSGRTLELSTSTAANKVKLKSGSEVKPELKVDKDFKADKKITGSWTYDNGYAKMTYKFNDDGTVEINQSDALNVDGTYLIKNGTIIIKYYYTDEVEMDVAYSVESNGLKLNDILYTKDDGSAKATTAAVTEAATETATTSAK